MATFTTGFEARPGSMPRRMTRVLTNRASRESFEAIGPLARRELKRGTMRLARRQVRLQLRELHEDSSD